MAQDFYFAWVAHGHTTFGVEHQVQDEDVIGCRITHNEALVPGCVLVIRNPRVGLLNEDRMQWAWVSHRKRDDSVVPIFHGRIVTMPADLVGSLVTVEFTARPEDYEAQKAALAETLKVVPYWDKLFVDEDQLADPDIVLRARPALWHMGRTDRLLQISNILAGEDGSVVLDGGAVVRDTMQIDYGQPLGRVKMTAMVEWKQAAQGIVPMAPELTKRFVAAGSPAGFCSSYTGGGPEGLEASWPRFGDGIGGGWTMDVSLAGLTNTDISKASLLKVPINPIYDTPPEGVLPGTPEYDAWLKQRMADPQDEARFARWDFRPRLDVHYEASRSMKEILTFEVTADLQALTVETEQSQPTELSAATSTVADPDKVTGVIPIGNARARAYFSTDRGQDSIAYLLNYCRSYILMAARAVNITIQLTDFEVALALNCRKDIVLSLDDLPGGVAGGKLTGYEFGLDNGQLFATITFGCVIGKGNTLEPPDAGTPSYVDEDYVGATYQMFLDVSIQPVPGELSYKRPVYTPKDDGLDFNALTAANILKDLEATELLTFTVPGLDAQTITIGPRVYTLKTGALSANDVKVGADNEETARNFTAAINRDEAQEGTTFGTGTLAHAGVSAITQDGIVRATARLGGAAGNAIALATNVTGATWGHATLQGGGEGLIVANGPAAQATALLATPEPGSFKLAIERLNMVATHVQMALKEVTGGPFETEIALDVDPLMVSRTIDLDAAAL